jgi:hypothetical protein
MFWRFEERVEGEVIPGYPLVAYTLINEEGVSIRVGGAREGWAFVYRENSFVYRSDSNALRFLVYSENPRHPIQGPLDVKCIINVDSADTIKYLQSLPIYERIKIANTMIDSVLHAYLLPNMKEARVENVSMGQNLQRLTTQPDLKS